MGASVKKTTPTLVVFCGRSGTGKTTLAEKITKLLAPEGARPVISTTTRPKRQNEIEGDEYEFITEEEFWLRHRAGQFAWFVEIDTPEGKIYHATEHRRLDEACASGISILVLTPERLVPFSQEVRKRSDTANMLFFWIRVDEEEILLRRLTKRDGEEKALNRLAFDRSWPAEIQNSGVSYVTVSGTKDPDKNAQMLASRVELVYYNLV